MRKIFYLLSIFFGITLLQAAEGNIGFVDMQRIANNYYDLREAKRELNSKIREWQAKRDSLKAEIDSLEKEFNKQLPMLTADEIVRKQEEISRKKQEYNAYVKKIWGENGELEKFTKKLVDPYAQRVKEVIATVAKNMGYTAILDKSSSTVLFISGQDDITQAVLQELNKGTTPAGPTRKKLLAVFPFKEMNSDAHAAGLGGKLQKLIYNGFNGSYKFDVKPLKYVYDAVQSQGITSYENMTYNIALTLAKQLGVDYFVFGNVKLSGDQVTFTVYMYRTTDGKKILEDNATVKNEDVDLTAKCAEITHAMIMKFKE